jgi:beta-N-acetylhexosaminidase
MVDQMTLTEKVGQLLVIGVKGTSFSGDMDNLIRNYNVGGVIIMGEMYRQRLRYCSSLLK